MAWTNSVRNKLKGLAQMQAWHVGDASSLPEQGEACEQPKRLACGKPGRRLRAYAREHMEK